jgi:hypothetical protein
MRAMQCQAMALVVWFAFKVDTSDEKQWVSWLGRRRRIRGEDGTNAIAAFEALVEKITAVDSLSEV